MGASLRSLKILSSPLVFNPGRSLTASAEAALGAAPEGDVELVAKAKLGDRGAFTELVRRHQRGLLRIVLRLTRELPLAEDIVQETFIKAYEKMDLFEGRSSFKSWLYQVGLNTAKNRFRSRPQEEFTTDTLQGGVDPGAERDLVKSDVSRALRTEIDQLPERQRIAITLRVFEDLSFKEIAQIMNCPYDTAKANYRHALLKLRERFESELVQGGALENWNSVFSAEADSPFGFERGHAATTEHQEAEQ